ncbi:hypothetical protein LMH87_006600 [Akanthomyces muscarius]|uniref:Uncharacterized protein n=1 Tax=Akanthomyces muscarius TaxID=2231603 RepID=A0A9W8UQG8_AKAMU|nr:hypothetical protein LMH87_006600 [Akanthomyces muscarius]KAJ4164947.1 hypothetical protein LMH87_006600 [Akanthomyces muscarius]
MMQKDKMGERGQTNETSGPADWLRTPARQAGICYLPSYFVPGDQPLSAGEPTGLLILSFLHPQHGLHGSLHHASRLNHTYHNADEDHISQLPSAPLRLLVRIRLVVESLGAPSSAKAKTHHGTAVDRWSFPPTVGRRKGKHGWSNIPINCSTRTEFLRPPDGMPMPGCAKLSSSPHLHGPNGPTLQPTMTRGRQLPLAHTLLQPTHSHVSGTMGGLRASLGYPFISPSRTAPWEFSPSHGKAARASLSSSPSPLGLPRAKLYKNRLAWAFRHGP